MTPNWIASLCPCSQASRHRDSLPAAPDKENSSSEFIANNNLLESKDKSRSSKSVTTRAYLAFDVVLILCVAAASFLFHLGNTHFWEQDEGFYAATALEMHQRNDWIVPTFNQELFAHKPPMMFWGIQLGYWLCGVGETGARLFSAIAATGTCLLTYLLASKLFDRLVGLIAAIALSTNLMFCVVARSATADAYLAFFVFASLACWFLAYRQQWSLSTSDDRSLQSRIGGTEKATEHVSSLATSSKIPPTLRILQSISFRWWACSYICMGLAVLAKGPIGFLFPITVLAASFWLEPLYCRTKSLLQSMHPAYMLRILLAIRLHWGILIVLLVAAPWFVLVDMQSKGAFLKEFIGVHHLGRFSNAMDNHSGPIYYYGLACLLGFYPWSGFAIPAVLCWFSRLLRKQDASSVESNGQTSQNKRLESQALLWLSLWFGVYLIVFSMARTKLPNYVLPAYPVLAIGVAYYLRDTICVPKRWFGWQTVAYLCFLIVGLTIAAAPFALSRLPATATHFERLTAGLPDSEGVLMKIALTGVPLAGLGLMGLVMRWWTRRSASLPRLGSEEQCRPGTLIVPAAMGAASLLFVTHLSYSLAPQIDQLQSPQILVQRMRTMIALESDVNLLNHEAIREPAPLPLTVISMFRPTLVYYAGGKVEFIGKENFAEAVRDSLAKGEIRYWLIQQEDWEDRRGQIPASLKVLDSAANFPKPGHLYLVGQSL